jgi:glutamine amidotransferase
MIAIVDYGLGNIKAFANVYSRLRLPAVIANGPDDLKNATKIILPGVGAFDRAMELLDGSGMRQLLDEMVLGRKIPVLGICVGMQILAHCSEEGQRQGLGWIDGEVRRLDDSQLQHRTRLPHMGWNNVMAHRTSPLFHNMEDPVFYFLHSYFFSCADDKAVFAEAEYGQRFACAVNVDNIYGVQFHPEKSHHNGIQLLRNFGEM